MEPVFCSTLINFGGGSGTCVSFNADQMLMILNSAQSALGGLVKRQSKAMQVVNASGQYKVFNARLVGDACKK